MTVQAMKATKGFTLVELIVVITILAILATIGFLSLQGYTQDAKETKTVANLRTVASAMVNESAISGKSIADYITAGADPDPSVFTGTVNSGYVDLTNNDEYVVGDVNANALKIDGSKFFDKNAAGVEQKFRAAAVTFKDGNRFRSMFQVAGTLKTATSEVGLVEGSYAKGVGPNDFAGIIESTTPGTPVTAGSTTAVPYEL